MSSPVLSKFKDLHESIWGKTWETSKIRVKVVSPTEASQPTTTTTSEEPPIIKITASLEPGVPKDQEYDVFRGLSRFIKQFGITSDISDPLVGRGEYSQLLGRILNGDLRASKKIVVTGHPGIGALIRQSVLLTINHLQNY